MKHRLSDSSDQPGSFSATRRGSLIGRRLNRAIEGLSAGAARLSAGGGNTTVAGNRAP